VRQLLAAERSWAEAKGQLFRTWIEYHVARLDLYDDLGLSAP
jgi:hypothetical protein